MINYIVHFYRLDTNFTDKKQIQAQNMQIATNLIVAYAQKWGVPIKDISVETDNPKCKGLQKYCSACLVTPASQSRRINYKTMWFCRACVDK